MKKFIALTLAASLAAVSMTACSAQKSKLDTIKEAGVIKMATSPDFAPMEFENISANGTKEYVGSDIELGKYIAEKLGVQLQIEAMDFAAVQAAVATGSVDMAISGFSWTEERAENMELSTFYNLDEESNKGQGLMVLKEKADQFKSADDFSGLIVGAQNGSLQQQLASTQLPSDVEIKPIGALNEGILSLQTGKIDALAIDGANGELFCETYDGLAMCEFKFVFESEGNVIACQKGQEDLIAAINDIIKEVNEKGLYTEWNNEATELAKSLGLDVE